MLLMVNLKVTSSYENTFRTFAQKQMIFNGNEIQIYA